MADAFGRTHISAASDFQAIRCPDPPTRDRKDSQGVSRSFPKARSSWHGYGSVRSNTVCPLVVVKMT